VQLFNGSILPSQHHSKDLLQMLLVPKCQVFPIEDSKAEKGTEEGITNIRRRK